MIGFKKKEGTSYNYDGIINTLECTLNILYAMSCKTSRISFLLHDFRFRQMQLKKERVLTKINLTVMIMVMIIVMIVAEIRIYLMKTVHVSTKKMANRSRYK